MSAQNPAIVHGLPERECHTWGHLFDSGLLWFINRSLFHPIGYALGIDGESGWTLHYAGGEVVRFSDGLDEDAKLRALEALMETARAHRVSPPTGLPLWPEGSAT